MGNQNKLKSIFSRSEEREIAGESLTLYAPSAQAAAKIEKAQIEVAKHLKGGPDEPLSLEAIKAGKAFTLATVQAVLQITEEEARQLLVICPQAGEEVSDFLGLNKAKEAAEVSDTSF